ncbi:MAG: ATP-binding protein, partial [Firmicutes bacterium]|nr:ATP-binding protein [Bacillota bacterium]
FITCYDLLKLFKAALSGGATTLDLLELRCWTELLIIDDVGANRFSEFDQAEFSAFINHRYQEMRPIILTTNLNKTDLKEYIGERIISRLSEICETIVLTGKDRRMGNG